MAIAELGNRFASAVASGNLVITKARFSEIGTIAKNLGIFQKINGVCADLGVSSPQLDRAERGFSFSHDGPLDMRMDRAEEMNAQHLVNTFDYESLSQVFFRLGEEPRAKQIAREIIRSREIKPITSTAELAEIIKRAAGYFDSKTHPATRCFMGIRMMVNEEMKELNELLNNGFAALALGGRFGVISFHSLEDRAVKSSFQILAGKNRIDPSMAKLPLTQIELEKLVDQPKATIIKPFPLIPNEREINENSRARSAKLRVIEKISE
jgi:16S rRNA (cytosine1402-N4)-methyltransferase